MIAFFCILLEGSPHEMDLDRFLHFNVKVSDVRMAGYSLSSLENHLDSLGASYVDGVRVRVNPRYFTRSCLYCR